MKIKTIIYHNKLFQLLRSICLQPKLFYLSLVALCVMMMCKIESRQFYVDLSNEWVEFINDTGFCIASSYIAGYIFYIFSVLYPWVKRRKKMLGISKNLLRYTIDDYDSMFSTVCDCCTDIDKSLLIKSIVQENNGFCNYIDWDNCSFIQKGLCEIKTALQYFVSISDYLEDHELGKLNKTFELIEKCLIIIKDKSDDQKSKIPFGNEELENWINSLFELKEVLTDMYDHINKNV